MASSTEPKGNGAIPVAKENGVETPSSHSISSPATSRVKRKQWVLHDGPHGSLQRLRLRMAEEGCGHSQVALAKQFLSENCGESDQMAIHWLLKAADQGHYEGVELLKTCFESNRGITESNCHKIRSFLDMSQHERAARLGAKTLFANMAQGSEFITTKQLEQWLEDSFAIQQKSQLENGEPLKQVTDSSSLVLGGELISEQHMMSAASVYASGHFPPLLRLLNLGSKQNIGYFCQRLRNSKFIDFTHPLSLTLMFTLVVLSFAVSNPLQLLNMQLSSALILLGWVLALVAAIVFTNQSCRSVREWNVFHSWSLLLSQHAQRLLEPAVPESLYIYGTFPYHLGRLSLATVLCISLQPALHLMRSSLPHPGLWIPFGELSVLATILCSACLDSHVGIGLYDFLCLICWILWRTDVSPWAASYLEDESADWIQLFQSPWSARLHVGTVVTSVGILILVFLYIQRLRQFNYISHGLAWSLPHFLSLFWLFLAIDWFQLSGYDGVLRGVGFFVASVLLRSNWLTKANLLLCVTTYSSVPAISLTPWMALGLVGCLIAVFRLKDHLLTSKYQSILLVVCLAILTFRAVHHFKTADLLAEDVIDMTSSNSVRSGTRLGSGNHHGLLDDDIDSESKQLSLEKYHEFCSYPPTSGIGSSIAGSQHACSALNGFNVDWEGTVKQVSIESRYNAVESLLHWLPSKHYEWLVCKIGETWPPCDNHDQSLDSRRCHFIWRLNHNRGNLCHLERFSKFNLRLQVELKMSTYFLEKKLAIELLAGPRFQNLGLKLLPDHHIRFSGSLSSPTLGGSKPELVLSALECLNCQLDDPFDHSGEPSSVNQPEASGDLPDVTVFATSALQGAVDFVLPHFLRVNVSQLFLSR